MTDRLLTRLASRIYHLRFVVLLCGAAALCAGILYGAGVFAALRNGGMQDPGSGSSRAEAQIAAKFPRSAPALILIVSGRGESVDSPNFRLAYARLVQAIRSDRNRPLVTAFTDPYEHSRVARNRKAALILVGLGGSSDEQAAAYERLRRDLPKTGLTLEYGGPAVASAEIGKQVQIDLVRSGMIAMPLLAILLLLIFRSAVAMMLPLILGAVSVLGSFALIRLIAAHAAISIFSAQIVGLLGLGLAIDYSLLFVSRFRDELAAGADTAKAVETTVCTAGEAIFFSGATVTVSLLGLMLFPEMFLRSMGLGGAIAVVMAVVASLTVLPAILSVLGPRVDRLPVRLPWSRASARSAGSDFWRRVGEFSVRRPAAVVVVVLGALIAAGAPFLHVRFGAATASSLPRSFEARASALEMQRDFADGQNPPIELVIDEAGAPTEPARLAGLSQYVAQIERIPGVVSVHSLVSLDARIPASDYAFLYNMPGMAIAQVALSQLVSGDTTLATVSYAADPSSAEAQGIVRRVRAIAPPPGAQVLVGGDTADLVDQLSSMRRHLPLAAGTIMAATFIVLLAMLSSLVIPLKAVVLNVLSLSAAFGLITWIFQDGRFQGMLRYTSSGTLDPTLPVLIFAIAFGLATDYEVFLVSRIKEEFLRTGDNTRSIVRGVEKTGGIISSAGLLLLVVVASFGFGAILQMKEMGIGLAIAVAVDAALVRALLVPASMQLFGAMNWWLPGPLRAQRRPIDPSAL